MKRERDRILIDFTNPMNYTGLNVVTIINWVVTNAFTFEKSSGYFVSRENKLKKLLKGNVITYIVREQPLNEWSIAQRKKKIVFS